MNKHIAIVEDEPGIRANYCEHLQNQGYSVSPYEDRPAALAAFQKQLPDLAILDIGLADEAEGGYELCRELRGMSTTLPIIFLTARDDDIDAISGLRLGADDYLTKDISLQNLSARIAALFRRMEALREPLSHPDILERGPLAIDLDQMRASYREQPLDLTLTEFWIIHALAKHPGHVKNRDQIMAEANIVVDDSTVTSHIKRIRRKFQQIDATFDGIETVYGMGYRWNNPGD